MDLLWSGLLLPMLIAIAHSAQSVLPVGVGVCDKLRTASDLGNTVTLSNEGLLAGAVVSTNPGSLPPMVQVIDFQLVCEVAGAIRDTVGGVSVVVTYLCMGTICRVGADTSTLITLTEQFNFECSSNDASQNLTARRSVLLAAGTAQRRTDPVANRNTPLADQCSQCVDQSVTQAADSVTHCRRELTNFNLFIPLIIFFFSMPNEL